MCFQDKCKNQQKLTLKASITIVNTIKVQTDDLYSKTSEFTRNLKSNFTIRNNPQKRGGDARVEQNRSILQQNVNF